jgi:hypothetical protein
MPPDSSGKMEGGQKSGTAPPNINFVCVTYLEPGHVNLIAFASRIAQWKQLVRKEMRNQLLMAVYCEIRITIYALLRSAALFNMKGSPCDLYHFNAISLPAISLHLRSGVSQLPQK